MMAAADSIIPTMGTLARDYCVKYLTENLTPYCAVKVFNLRRYYIVLNVYFIVGWLKRNIAEIKVKFNTFLDSEPFFETRAEKVFFKKLLLVEIAEVVKSIPLVETSVYSEVKEVLENKLDDAFINAMEQLVKSVYDPHRNRMARPISYFLVQMIEDMEPNSISRLKRKLVRHINQLRVDHSAVFRFSEKYHFEDDPRVINGYELFFIMKLYLKTFAFVLNYRGPFS